jgi:hypothetical protein
MNNVKFYGLITLVVFLSFSYVGCGGSGGEATEPGLLQNWEKQFKSNGGFAGSVAIDSEGNVYVVGHGENLLDRSVGYDWWIKRFDSDGNEDTENWDKRIDGNGGDDLVTSVIVDNHDNIYIVGLDETDDTVIKKFSSEGVEDIYGWDKKLDPYGADGNDPIGNDEANSIAVDVDNNVYVHGSYARFKLSTSWMMEYSFGVLEKFDSNGNSFDWDVKTENSYASSIEVDINGSIYATGLVQEYDITYTESDSFWRIIKIDSDGEKKWSFDFDYNMPRVVINSIAKDSNGNLYIVGYGDNLINESSGNDWWIRKLLNEN